METQNKVATYAVLGDVTLAKIEDACKSNELSEEVAHTILAGFTPHYQQFMDLVSETGDIREDEPKKARTLRLALRKIRVETDKTRKQLKDESKRTGDTIQAVYNTLRHVIEPAEKALDDIEKAEERREAARMAALIEERKAKLEQYTDQAGLYALGDMSEEGFQELLSAQRKIHEEKEAARIAAEKAAEEARLAAIEEQKRKDAELAEAKAKAAEEEQKRKAEEAERQKAEAEAKAREESLLAEKRKAEQELAKAKQKAEAQEAARKAAEEAERKEQERQAKIAAAAPDRDKLEGYIQSIIDITPPEMDNADAQDELKKQLQAFCNNAREIWKNLAQ